MEVNTATAPLTFYLINSLIDSNESVVERISVSNQSDTIDNYEGSLWQQFNGNFSPSSFNIDVEATIEPTTISKPFVIELNSISWLLALYSIIFLLAIVGNSLVILTLVQNKRMRTITNLFLLNLAVSDIFLGVFCMPFTLVGTILRNFIFGEIMCKLLPFLQGKFVC